MKLIKLELMNFKGIRQQSFDFNGKSVSIYGDNGTGKTTLFDAVTYLLYGKDSQDRKDFGIKTIEGGEEIHHIEHQVRGTFEHEGTQFTLQKTYKEKWIKKKGTETKEFTNHTTEYFVNDVPKSEKAYTSYISTLMSQEQFKLLTNPLYFHDSLKASERRGVLTSLVPEITNKQVLDSDDKYSVLAELLEHHNTEEIVAMLKHQKTKTMKKIEELPTRIDTLHMVAEDMKVSDISDTELDKKIAQLENTKKPVESSEFKKGVEQLESLQQKRMALIQTYMNDKSEKRKILEGHRQQLIESLSATTLEANQAYGKWVELDTTITKNMKSMEQLRNEYKEVAVEEFKESETCPTCGQTYPAEYIKEIRENFEINKQVKLKQINEQGMALKVENGKLIPDAQAANEEYEEVKKKEGQYKSLLDDVDTKIQELDAVNPLKHQDIQDLEQKIEEAKKLVEENKPSMNHGYMNELVALRQEKEIRKQKAATLRKIEVYREELVKEQEALEDIDIKQCALDEFVRAKMELVEKAVNEKFKFARFKLFKKQINGGIEQCCEAVYNGIPYISLNNASKVNIGLDIINTLSKVYGNTAPIFIDNAESVTSFVSTQAQLIKLVVSKKDKKLRLVEE